MKSLTPIILGKYTLNLLKLKRLFCKLFGHKELWNVDWMPEPDGSYVIFWCQRCDHIEYSPNKYT